MKKKKGTGKQIMAILAVGMLLFSGACGKSEGSQSGSDGNETSQSVSEGYEQSQNSSGEHVHSYTQVFVEPTKESQGYMLHTCSCNDSYKDGYTGILEAEETEKPVYRVLFIGNSYTYFNNLWDIFFAVSKGEGYELETASVTQGGYTLQQMADVTNSFGARVDNLLKTQKYDAVFLQEQSLTPATSPASFYDAVRALDEKVTANGAKGILYQTWARKAGSAELGAYGLTHESMTMKLAASYEAIAEECGMFLSPVGSAFYDVAKNHPEINLYNSDYSHPSPAGSYLAALCHYATVYGKSPVGVSYVCGVNTLEAAEILQQAAHKAVFGESIVTDEYRCSSVGVTQKK